MKIVFSFLIFAVTITVFGVVVNGRDENLFRYTPTRTDCKVGTIYHDGCNWCECIGETEDECDNGPCEATTEKDYVPEDKRSIHKRSAAKRSMTSTVCKKGDAQKFFLDKYECFCKDENWFWCRIESGNAKHDPYPTGHLEIDM